MPVGFTTVSGNNLQDATGALLSGATIKFQPVSSITGAPLCFRAGGLGGATSFEVVSAEVTGGAFSIQLCDTALTFPANIGYAVTVADDLTDGLLLFHACIQPTGTTWSLDSYEPNVAPQATIQVGPQGQPGIPGGVAGSMFDAAPTGSIDGTNAAFTLPGSPAILFLSKNGIRQIPGVDYTLVGGTVTFAVASVPQVGDSLWASGVTPASSTAALTRITMIDQADNQTYTYVSRYGELEKL